jgi:hypothetical protein
MLGLSGNQIRNSKLEIQGEENLNRQDAKNANKFKNKMQNAKHAIQNSKFKGRYPSHGETRLLEWISVLHSALHVLHFAFSSS